ncbi:MAG: hypothetical protein ACYTFY_07320 [Planctomycetota bacterium]
MFRELYGKMILGLTLTALVVTSGCIQQRRKVYLNPDGSGKIEMTVTTPQMNAMMAGMSGMGGANVPKPDPEAEALKAVTKMVKSSDGIDAWKDVSYKVLENGKMKLAGTAYFKDLNNVKIDQGGAKTNSIIKYMKNSDKSVTLTIENKKQKDKNGEGQKINKQQIAQMRMQMQMQFGMMKGMFAGFKDHTTLILPGNIAKSNNMQAHPQKKNTARIIIDGDKMLTKLEKMMKEDAFWDKVAEDNINVMKDGPPQDMMNEKLFGSKGPVTVTTTTDVKPLFDYETEMGEAKAKQAAMLDGLGIK